MKMNMIEYFLMTFDAGRLPYLKGIVKQLHEISKLGTGKKMLEIGCGNGIGSRLIDQIFQPSELIATEFDPRLVDVARVKTQGSKVRVEPGDASNLRFLNGEFDAVIGLSVIHHIPNWRDSVKELGRVIKPGGLLIIKELSIETFEAPFGRIAKRFVEHPYDAMLRKDEFLNVLKKNGFAILELRPHKMLYWLEDFFLVARKEG